MVKIYCELLSIALHMDTSDSSPRAV